MDAQTQPENLVFLTKRDTSEKVHPPSKLLCNWRHCDKGPRGGIASAERLCPFCHRVGYCCIYCLEQDIYAHATHECAQNLKKAEYVKVKYR